MDYKQRSDKWRNFAELEAEWKEWLQTISSDEKQLEDAFYKDLEFGTGGMRGEIGPGSNRMNTYTVRRASQGLANYIAHAGEEAKRKGVVIAYDSRRKSPEFSKEAAATLAHNGIRVYVYEQPRTTPQLSFSVRELGAYAGIVITASHNPPEYNGYKVYGEDGAQLNLEDADRVISFVNEIEDEFSVEVGSFDSLYEAGMIQILGKDIDDAYLKNVVSILHHPELPEKKTMPIVFTPLHGASGETVKNVFNEAHFENVAYVEEQFAPNGEFPTVKSPNPEEASAFELAKMVGKDTNAELLIAVDPDGDRAGIAVWNGSDYELLTGNQTGALLIEYHLTQIKEKGKLPPNGRIFKTIVTSDFGRVIAEYHGVSSEDVLTGFKFIGEKIEQYTHSGEYQFLFGYEESYGYLVKEFARDKDAIQATLLIAEAAAFYRSQGKSLLDVLHELYERHGYYKEALVSVTKKGADGAKAIQSLLTSLREEPILTIAGLHVLSQEDYLSQTRTFTDGRDPEVLTLPVSDVVKYILEDGSWVCVRPSGTEPKVKYYFGVLSPTENESMEKLKNVQEAFESEMERRFI